MCRRTMLLAITLLLASLGANTWSDESSVLTEAEVRLKIQELYDAYNNKDVKAIMSSRFGFEPGFGFRTAAPRATTGISDDQLRAGLTRGLELWESYEVKVNALNISIHGEVAVVWGTHTETVKPRGMEPEIIDVRFSQTLMRNPDGELVSIQSHRDIQKFGVNGRYIQGSGLIDSSETGDRRLRELIAETLTKLNSAENLDSEIVGLEYKIAKIDETMAVDWKGWSDGQASESRSAEREKERALFKLVHNYHRRFDTIIIDPPRATVLWTMTGESARNGYAMKIPGTTTFWFSDDGKIRESRVFTANRPSPEQLGLVDPQ